MENRDAVKARMFTLRIIFFALLMGQLVFFVIVHVIKYDTSANQELAKIFLVIGSILGITGISASIVSRLVIHRILKSSSDFDEAAGRFFTVTIITLALCEGPSLANMVFGFIAGFSTASYVIIGLLVLAQLMHFPTQFRLENAWEDAKRFD